MPGGVVISLRDLSAELGASTDELAAVLSALAPSGPTHLDPDATVLTDEVADLVRKTWSHA
ncbi:MAG: hypothetical protein R2737_02155 [Candidatus Nanopelagicales bacterium]